jgi:hypothetical protein
VGAPVSAARVAWVIWCLAWAGFWLTIDLLAVTGGYAGSLAGRIVVGALFVAAVSAIWLPFTRPRHAGGQAPPACPCCELSAAGHDDRPCVLCGHTGASIRTQGVRKESTPGSERNPPAGLGAG